MSLSKNRSLIFIIAALLLTNIVVLGYFLWFKKPCNSFENAEKDHQGVTTALQKDVGFNEQQIAKYKELKEKKWGSIRLMFEDVRKTRDSLFVLLSNENANDSMITRVADAIAQKQKELDLRAFDHFKQIRALCTPEQLPKYDSLVQRLIKKMGKPHRGEHDKSHKE